MLRFDIIHDYQHINYIEENDNINPQNETSFMNYYNRGTYIYYQ